jgi:hypothetical protein
MRDSVFPYQMAIEIFCLSPALWNGGASCDFGRSSARSRQPAIAATQKIAHVEHHANSTYMEPRAVAAWPVRIWALLQNVAKLKGLAAKPNTGYRKLHNPNSLETA